MTDSLLSLRDVACAYGDRVVLNDFNLEVYSGQIVCLLGLSGCGKTTVLRTVAGFEPVIEGRIKLRNTIVSNSSYMLPPEKRGLGMVFQDYALFPHMNVTENICFGLRGATKAEKKSISSEMLSMVGLSDMGERFAHELSGGQQQRIALARALAVKPDLILMDEPFSNLDVELRERLGVDVREILKEVGIAAIMVTHDQSEAFALADVVGVMQEGKIMQWDTPYNLYHEPANKSVAGFVGQGVFIEGELLTPQSVLTEMGLIQGNRSYSWEIGTTVDVLLRPDDIVPDVDSNLRGEVVYRAFRGASIMYTIRLESGKEVLALFSGHYDYSVGEVIGFRLAVEHLIGFVE